MMIPKPPLFESSDGVFPLTTETTILVEENTPALRSLGDQLAALIAPLTGQPPQVAETEAAEPPPRSILLATCAPNEAFNEEGYELRITPQSVLLRAPKTSGVLYGIQTLRQLWVPGSGGGDQASIPCARIVDKPRFAWRGFMLDCARHFMPVDLVKRTIDLIAFHKFNRFHWHLTDDQGWRLEIQSHPELTDVGAWRGEKNYGGFYARDEVRNVVAYAADRGITVVPEIDLPGHSMAALAAHPELSCQRRPLRVPESWGIFKDIFCAGEDKTFALLEDVLGEVCELFPSPWIHLGGDEVPTERWRACKKCKARIRAENLDGEKELLGWFLKRLARFLATKGRRIIGWDETIEPGLAPGSLVQIWRRMDTVASATALGHEVIVSPSSHCHLDSPLEKLSVEEAYAFEPVPDGLPPANVRYIIGGEAVVWTETVQPDQLEACLLPRLTALAEVFWSPKGKRNWQDFQFRLNARSAHSVDPGAGDPDPQQSTGALPTT